MFFYQITPIINVLSGLVLSGSILKKIGALKEPMQKFQTTMAPHELTLGVVTFVLGVLNLINRTGLGYIWYFHGGYGQSLFAIAMGILLAGEHAKKYSWGAKVYGALLPYREPIGFVGFLVGLSAII